MTKDEMVQLRNTLMLVEVKGQSAIYMADCLKFVEENIKKVNNETETVSGEVE